MFEIRDIILGALTHGPANGYEIRRRINSAFAHFQSISAGSLYPALAKLKAGGAVTEFGPPESSLDRRTFEITEAGRALLRRKVETSDAGERLRSDFLAGVYFSDVAGSEEVARLMEERSGILNQEIRQLLALPLSDMSNAERFTVRYALAVRRAALEFLRHEGRAILTAINLESRKSID